MIEAGAFATGIAATMGIDEDTLRKRCPTDNKCSFSEFRQQKLAKGDELLRTAQFKNAMSGNVTMQIWLGKQRLNQADKQEITGKGGKDFIPTKYEVEVIDSDGSTSNENQD